MMWAGAVIEYGPRHKMPEDAYEQRFEDRWDAYASYRYMAYIYEPRHKAGHAVYTNALSVHWPGVPCDLCDG